jgi:CHAT domain-containing protein/Tfp pilus assembly protein PilF
MERAKGPDHTDVAAVLNNLAELYKNAGDYEKAEPLYQRSLAIRERVFGPDHPDVAQSLNNLAGLYDNSGDYKKAEPLYQRSLAIQEKVYGPDHPDVAAVLGNLAGLCENLGEYAKAKQLYQRSLAIREKAYGPDHLHVAQSLNNLAFLYSALGDFGKAHALLKEAQSIDNKLIKQVIGFTSEEQKMKFLATRKLELSFFMSLVNRELFENASARKDALDAWLQRKGVILEAQKRFQEALVYSDDPEAVKVFQELARVRTRLSRIVFSGPGKDWEAYQKQIADLEKQEENLEARLSQISRSFVLHKKATKADSESVAKALPEKTVLLEFARIEDFTFKAGRGKKNWSPARYVSFVLHSGEGGRVEMVDLGDAEEIDTGVALLKQEITDFKRISGQKPMKASRALYEMVFEPLESKLGEAKEVYISPDGNLNLIPFEVLQGPDGRFLIEDYTFNYLCAGRDLLRFGENQEKENKALLIGDPDFDMDGDERESVLTRLALQEKVESAPVRRSTDMRGLHFSRLQGTGEEVRAIFNLLGEGEAELYTRGEALEQVLRSRNAPRILHLATHGFFLSDMQFLSLADDSNERGLRHVLTAPGKKNKRTNIENPLIRSGIALAGANNALNSSDTDQTDGIVTSEKVLGLSLQGTDMVVLSACKTGIGEVSAGEGVYGLRRAFTQAGAKSIVMSMWSVPDKETKEFMINFYEKMMSGGLNRCQALRQAALQQMKIVKERYGTVNPFFWGAFVFMGEP